MCAKATVERKKEATVEEKLESLFVLQKIDSQIDKINFIKGELPMEVQDMEDEIAGLNTRIENIQEELTEMDNNILDRNRIKEETKNQIQKLEKQQNSVKNNREFESISKEIELAKLEIELCEKKLKDFTEKKQILENRMEDAKKILNSKVEEMTIKKDELTVIEGETNKDLDKLKIESNAAKENVDDRLIQAYDRIRTTYRNGLAIVAVDRDSCGGCYAKIPPQKQLEIKQRKKVIVCENCGRIFAYPKEQEVDDLNKPTEEAPKVTRSRSKRATRQD